MVKSQLPSSSPIRQNDTQEVPTSSLSKENPLLEYKAERRYPVQTIISPSSRRIAVDMSEEEILREVEAIWEIDLKKVDDTA